MKPDRSIQHLFHIIPINVVENTPCFVSFFIGAYLRSVLPEFESIDPFRDHTCKILFDHLGMQIKLCEGRGKQAVNL